MLIKVKPGVYVNTDHLIAVHFYDSPSDIPSNLFNWCAPNLQPTSGPCALLFTVNRGYSYLVTASAARGLLDFAEANDSLDLNETPPEPRTLKSQIAYALRNTWKGASNGQLDAVFPAAGISAIETALTELYDEKVIVCIDGLWYHASSSEAQSWFKSSLDLSSATEALPDASDQAEEHSGLTVGRKSES